MMKICVLKEIWMKAVSMLVCFVDEHVRFPPDDKSFFLHLRLFLPYKPFGCFHEQHRMKMKCMTEEKKPTRLTHICQMHTCTEKL